MNASTNKKTITVVGGNLFKIAQEQYGDATQWAAIADANGLTDPQLSGMQTLIIPSASMAANYAGGILGNVE